MSESKIKNFLDNLTFKKILWLAPIMYLFHIIEEALFGFHIFMNKHLGTNATLRTFLISNAIIMVSYIVLISMYYIYPNKVTGFFNLAGLAAAQFFNTFFHLIMTIRFGEYCPGLITGFVLYIPYVSILARTAYQDGYITKVTGALAFIIGATLMTLFEVEGLTLIILFGWPIIVITCVIVYYFRESKKIDK